MNDVHRNIEYSTLMYDYGCDGIKTLAVAGAAETAAESHFVIYSFSL